MKYLTLLILIFIFSCSTGSNYIKKTDADSSVLLIGQIDRAELFRELPEWNLGLTYYRPDPVILDSLNKVTKDLSVEIYLGTWCGDSRREVPHFIKIIDALEITLFNDIKIWAVDRDKKIPDSNLAQEKDIKFVATFIIYQDNEELGRIIESPNNTLESDLLKIVW
jgi:hypothetical protein